MILAIEHIHSLPACLSYVSTLPDITHKLKRDIDELKQRLIDTWDHWHSEDFCLGGGGRNQTGGS